MGISFIVKQTPTWQYVFNDEFDTFNSGVWVTTTNLDNVGVNAGWMNIESNANYGILATGNLGLSLPKDEFRIECRARYVSGTPNTSAPNFGLMYGGVGFWWYPDTTFKISRRPSTGFWYLAPATTRGLFTTTTEPFVITMQQSGGNISMSVSYEEVSHQIYDWSDTGTNFVPATANDGILTIGWTYQLMNWEVDYIRLGPPI